MTTPSRITVLTLILPLMGPKRLCHLDETPGLVRTSFTVTTTTPGGHTDPLVNPPDRHLPLDCESCKAPSLSTAPTHPERDVKKRETGPGEESNTQSKKQQNLQKTAATGCKNMFLRDKLLTNTETVNRVPAWSTGLSSTVVNAQSYQSVWILKKNNNIDPIIPSKSNGTPEKKL